MPGEKRIADRKGHDDGSEQRIPMDHVLEPIRQPRLDRVMVVYSCATDNLECTPYTRHIFSFG